MMRNNKFIHGKLPLVAVIILQFFLLSCGKLKGEFAFKSFTGSHYKRINKKLEFEKNRKIDWIYKFKNFPSEDIKIGIIILKKEIVWVDIQKKAELIGLTKKIVYGSINNLETGKYRIVLTRVKKNNELIAARDFVIYSDEEDEFDDERN